MNFNFDKYQGAGNDFIMIDDRSAIFPEGNASIINQLCNRHVGIGADGLILLQNSTKGDFKMCYFNADGNPGSLCGNGSRCAFAFARSLNIVKNKGVFEAVDGLHFAFMKKNNLVSLDMNDVVNFTKNGDSLFLDTGSPHHLELVDDISKINVKQQGAAIRYGEPYLDYGTNVNYIEMLNENTFKIRTYERGVEEETLACGTGAVAAGVGVHYLGLTLSNCINIHTLGGVLKIIFTPSPDLYSEIKLIGPAKFIFSGNFEIK
jgi:diaminopimelate epimerase